MNVTISRLREDSRRFLTREDVYYPRSMIYSPQGNLTIGHHMGTISIRDADLNLTTTIEAFPQDEVNAIAYHPAGDLIAGSRSRPDLKVWDRNFNPMQSISTDNQTVIQIAISPKGDVAAILEDWDGQRQIVVWDSDYSRKQTISDDTYYFKIAYTPNNYLVVLTMEGFLTIWDYHVIQHRTILLESGGVAHLSVSPQSTIAVSHMPLSRYRRTFVVPRVINVYNLHLNLIQQTNYRPGPDDSNPKIGSLTYGPSGDLAVGIRNRVDIFNRNLNLIQSLEANIENRRDSVSELAYSRSGDLAAGLDDGGIAVWNAERFREQPLIGR